MSRASACAATLLAAALVVACDSGDGRDLRPPTEEERGAVPTTTTTTTSVPDVPLGGLPTSTTLPATTAAQVFSLQLPWSPGGPIDVRFTCHGDDRSPALAWTAPPAGTVELALLVTDDDANGFVHWAVAGIAPASGDNGEGAQITGALEGRNDFGRPGWGGPCPPAGAPHTYRFRLYALNQQSELPDDFTGADLQATADPTAIAVAESTGTYQSST
jgi:Raf kinase inhibitor-like YbhB/YbcL family protein